MNLEEYSQYRETLLHEQPGFAYNTYLCTIPQDFARVDLHWHDQMEIIYVKKGRGTVTAASRKYPVMAGSIMPILPGELHAIDGDPGVRMEYENIIFPLSLLDNQVENDWARRNILTPLQMGTLRFPRPIYADTAMHAEVSAALDAADDACSKRPDGYSLLVRSSLFRFFFVLYTHRIANTECTDGSQINTGGLFQVTGDAHGLQNGIRAEDQHTGDYNAYRQIKHQTQFQCLMSNSRSLCTDILGHHRHHT